MVKSKLRSMAKKSVKSEAFLERVGGTRWAVLADREKNGVTCGPYKWPKMNG